MSAPPSATNSKADTPLFPFLTRLMRGENLSVDEASEFFRAVTDINANPTQIAGALVALTKSFVRGKMKDDEVIVVADVFGDGLAQISEVIEPSRDLQAVRELQEALKTNPAFAPPFVPANLDQRSNTVRVVLRIQRVDVQTY